MTAGSGCMELQNLEPAQSCLHFRRTFWRLSAGWLWTRQTKVDTLVVWARVAIAATGVSSPNQAFATALVTFTCGCRAWLCFSGKGLRDADHEDISEEAMHFVF